MSFIIIYRFPLYIQKIKYFTHAKSSTKKTEENVLNQEYIEGCDSGQERDFHVDVLVPTVPSNHDEICNIIKIKYFIRVSKKKKIYSLGRCIFLQLIFFEDIGVSTVLSF